MTAFPYSACFFLCVVFLLSFTDAAPAPVAEGDLAQSQALDFHNTEAGSSRCYYNFQHYEEGDRIITNEPCLNCTCHKRMLMCYLRVCPFTKPVGQDCTVEKKPDQCCPVITCPEVPVDIMTSSTTDATSSSAVGHISKYGCTLEDNTFYPDGVQMPSDPKKPCELCYCIHNNTACVRQECTLNVEGCKPVYQEGVCCPVRYDCDYNEITTTERPSTGGLMLGTTASPTQECRYGDIVYNDGELIETDKPCESCYCMRGDIVCAVRSCGEPMEGKDCHALPPPEGQCCSTTFQCENGTISVDNLTTESSMIIHPSQVETDEPTKEPEPQSTAEEASDAKEEETVTDKKDEEAASSIEVLPSDSPKEDENEESKHEEDKTGVHPDESIQSEPTDTDELEEEEALDNIPEHPDHEPGTQGPDISEQLATSAPNIPEKDITESQSNIISHKPSSEESPAQGMAESSHEDNEVVNEGQESVKDKVKPSDDSESAGSEGENGTGSSEFIPENQEFVTETANKPEETSENKLEVESGHEGSESTATEVTHSGESEHPDEPTIAKDPVLTNLLDKKDEVVPTEAEEEKQPIPIAPEESVPSGTHNVEAIKPDTSESTGTEADETQTESNKDILSTGESIVETHKKPEIENESVTTNENEIKYEETPSKTPESLDQVKEPEIYTEKDVPSATEKPELHASEGSASTDDNKQGTNNDQLKEEEVVNPEQPSIEVTASPAPSEENIPEASEHFHKEPAPPRKEDASPEELEQRPQHPEGSMTKAEDSISDSQDQTEVTVTKMPGHVEEAETPQSVEHPSEVDKTPVDTTENNINHDGGDESLNTAGIQEGQDQETPDVQTEQTIISETPTGQNSQEHEIQPSEVSELPETSDSEHKTTEPATAPVSGSEAAPATDDIESEETEVTADESQPTELPKEEHSESHEDESVPTVVVIEPESETQTDSLPEETSHDEVKPTTVPSQDIIHNQSSDEENGHQSLQTGKPVETEEETTESGEEEHPVAEKQPASDNNAENENISSESTQSPPEVIVVEDHMTQDNTEHTSHNEDITPSTDTFDNSESSDTQEKESENVTDQEVTGGIPDKTQEESIPTKVDSSSTEKEIVSSPEADQSPLPEKEAVEQIHPDTAENVESLNELKPDESDKHEAGTPTESSVTGEESTETLVKTGNEEAESEKKGDEFITESKPTEAMESHEPESDSLAEVHHDPVESEPTEFENEIVDDHLLGQGGAIDNEMPMVIPGPIGVIPGEGDCLVEGQTYTNNSNIPSKSPCHKECTCISSVVHCQGIDCDPPPPELANCMPVHQGDLCCPMYACDGDTPEGPQSHNQMGANEDHTTTHEAQTPESGSDIKEHSEEPGATEQPTTLTEESELVHTPDHASSESETHKTDDEHQPMPHEEESSQGGETSPPAENVPESSEGGNPEETPGKTELNESSPEKENITPSPDAGVQEHEDQSVDDKHPGESSTEKSDTPGEDLEIKPDSEASPSEEILTEGEKEIQPTVLTDQSEPSGAESEEATATETSAVDEPSSQPDKNNIVSEQENLTGPNENEQPHKPEAPITEISQTSTDETEGSAGHKASESAVQIDSTLETGTQAPPEGTDENLHSEIEEITGEQTTNKITQEEAQSETEVSVEQTPSSGVHHDPSEEFEHEKESETVSTDLSVDQSNDQSEDSHKPSTETHGSDAVEDEDTEHNVQEIVTDSSIVGSQDDGVKKETQETQEPNEPEILVTSNPNVEETGQQGEPTESNNNVSEPESEGHIEPSEAAKPQTVHIPSVSLLNEDSATELVSKPTESSLDENLPNVENEGLSTDTKGEISPTYSTTGEEQISSEQKPLNELETEGSKPEEDHEINETRDETVTSAVVPENEISHETKPSNTETPPRPEEEETDTHETLAPEEPAHDDTSETEVQNEEITENSVEVHHGSSTQTPSFDGPSTQEPSFDAEHGDQTHQEATKGPETIEESVPSKGTSEKEEAPESDNLITDDKHVTSSEHPEGTQDQSQESSSVGTDDKPQLEDDSDKHELETTESSKHGNSETSETTITPESLPEEHISESPTQEPQQAEHETVEPPHDIQGPSQESSEPAMPEDSHLEEEIIHEGIEDDHEEEVLPAHPESTEIPIEEEIHEEGEHNNEGVIPPHEEVVSTNTVEETSTEPVEHTDDEIEPAHEDTAPVHEETVPAHEDTAPVHEETVPAHEDTATVHEETVPAHEDTAPVHEETVSAHEETAAAHEESATTHEGTETIHEETGLAHEETEPTKDETQPAQEDTEPAHEGTEPAPEETEPVHVETETTHEETETAHDGNEPIHEENEPVHEGNKPVHEEKEPIHEENEPVHEENEPVHQENEPVHEENEPVHEENESVHEENEPVHEENEPVHEENEPVHEATEGAHQVPIHEGVSVNEPEADPSSNEANETEHPSESEITNESEQTHRPETEHEDEHPIVEPEHPDSGHHEQEPEPQTHETDQPPNENVIGELEHPTHETQPEVHEPEQTIHEEGISHTQDSGSFPSMPGVTHTVEDSKPHHSKPDNPELPSEDQFTPDVDMDYDVSEDGAFGPGTCRYGGKVYVSAQQIPRDDPCDFCFCFRSDIICLQQSCPPPIHRCHQEPIQGYCCPRYQCPVSMATSLNITTTTSTTTTTLPPHFFAHAYRGAARQSGCFHRGRAYEVGEEIASASGPCLQCICGSDGQMSCDPKVCNPEPMVRKLMEAAVSHRRR